MTRSKHILALLVSLVALVAIAPAASAANGTDGLRWSSVDPNPRATSVGANGFRMGSLDPNPRINWSLTDRKQARVIKLHGIRYNG